MKILEGASYVALLVVCSLGAYRLWQYKPPASPPTVSASAPAPTTVSGRIPVDLTSRKKWMILVLSTECHFCIESAPFHKGLVEAIGDSNDIGLIAVFPQGKPAVDQYEYAHDFHPSTVLTDIALSKLQVRGTPTLLWVDQRGTVLKHWDGRLGESQEREVRAELTKN